MLESARTFPVSEYRAKLLTVALLVLFAFAREPRLFLFPRIWAEEGSVYIQSVFANGVLGSLLLPHLGYFSLFNNFVVAGGLALFGLDGVAYATTYASLVVMLLSVCAPLILRSPLWETGLKKSILVVYALIVSSGEIWLNTVNAQFYFCLFACFLLFSEKQEIRGGRAAYVLFMTSISAFTGVTSVVLFPFFAYRVLTRRNNYRIEISVCAILFVGLIVQMVALLVQLSGEGLGRLSLANVPNLASGFLNTFLTNVGALPALVQGLFLAALVVLGGVSYVRSKISILPLFLALYLCLVFSLFSLGMSGGPRYGYPVAVLIFLFLINASSGAEGSLQAVRKISVATVFFAAVAQFGNMTPYYESYWLGFSQENILRSQTGQRFLMLFPQGPGSTWRIEIDDSAWASYRRRG